MAIAFEGVDQASANSATSLTVTNVAPTGTNRILVVGIGTEDATTAERTVTSVAFGGVPLTLVRADDNDTVDFHSELWYLVNPSTVSGSVVITMPAGGTSRIRAGALCYSGVHQTTPIDAHNGANAATGHPSTSITTLTADAMLVDVVSVNTSGIGTPGTGQTTRWDQTGTGQEAGGSDELVTTATSYTQSWTIGGGTGGFTHSIVALKDVNASAAIDLTVQDASHAHAVDNVVLTQVHMLTVGDGAHGHTSDAVALTQVHNLAVADATHAHSVDNLTITITSDLVAQDASHAHTVDNVVLTQGHVLTVADALHTHSSDSIALTQVHILTIADGAHAHTADNVVLGTIPTLIVSDSFHAHTADSIVLVYNILPRIYVVAEFREYNFTASLQQALSFIVALADEGPTVGLGELAYVAELSDHSFTSSLTTLDIGVNMRQEPAFNVNLED